MQILSLVWGILAFLAMLVAFLPCLGALNWLVIPLAFIGMVLSTIALVTARDSSKAAGITGLILNAAAMLLGAMRLLLGGGIL